MSQPKFLQEVAAELLTEKDQLLKTVVVLPNQRAGLFLKRRLSEQIHEPLFLPEIVTIEEFFHQLSGLTKVEQVEQLFRLFQSHQRISQDPDSFDRFLTWAPTFLSDCSEIDTNLIEVDEFFTTLYRDREIRNWNVADELTDLQKRYLAFWKTAEQLYRDFTTNLLKDGKAYNGLSYRYAIENIETKFPKLPYKNVAFVGFNALNRAEEELFDYVYQNNAGRFFWDIDDYYLTDEDNKAGQYFREYAELWQQDKSLQKAPVKIGSSTESIQVIEAPNDSAQCEIAAQLVGELASGGEFGSDTAIVLGDEQLLEPLLFQLPKKAGTYNITMGRSLSRFPVFHLFDDYFALQHSLIQQGETTGYTTGMLKPLLISPFLRMLENKPHSQRLMDEIIENNISLLWLDELNEALPDECVWKSFLQPKESLNDLIQAVDRMIEKLRNAFLQKDDKLSIQVLFEMKKIFQQFRSYLEELPVNLPISAFRNLFKQVARGTRIPYEGEPLEGLQIMGVLETRCLDFDNIILLSTNEGILPKGQSSTSFIPYVFKDHFNIQTFKDKDAIYAYTFYRLLHHAKQVHFVFNGQTGNLGGGEVSRFVQQIEAELAEKTHKQIPVQRITASYPQRLPHENSYRIDKNEEVINTIIDYLENKGEPDRTTGLSPSSIKQLVNAPIDFYFQRLLSVKEPKELEEDIEMNTFGTIVHNTLEELYKPLIGVRLTEENLTALNGRISSELDLQIKKVFKKGDTNTGMNLLYKRAAKTLVKQVVKLDLQRINQHAITILSLEEDLACVLPVEAFGKTVQVNIRGKADRMQQRDGSIEVIDYKTGRVGNLKSKDVANIHDNPDKEKLHQILCYALMMTEGKQAYDLSKIRPAMQALKSWQSGLSFIDDNPDFLITDDLINEYKEQLRIIIRNLLDPSQPFVPESDEKRLEWSGYKGIYL